ncbi:hypothetical protein [Streptomyces abikoensis]|uniref:Uncharacterized protein n=1 Tax=Streptomyces abikoensis TaxID=97398 RepID=A0ABW7T002_9ACTN
MTDDAPRALLERLRAIDWEDEDAPYDHAESRAALLREHLRRTALWARVFGAELSWPYIDLAELIDPTVRAGNEVLAELRDYLDEEVGWPQVEATLVAAVHWAAFRSGTQVALPDLDDPYEPLLLMYERGGGFTIESGFIDLNGVEVRVKPLPAYASEEPVVALDSAALDTLDEDGLQDGEA